MRIVVALLAGAPVALHVDAGEVTTDATKYAGDTGASGARLTAKRVGRTWVPQGSTMRWAA